MSIGIGCFIKDQYDELLKISSDSENMDSTWEEWLKNKERAKQEMSNKGVICVDVKVDLFELMDYCQKERLLVNGKSRARFVQYLLSSGKNR